MSSRLHTLLCNIFMVVSFIVAMPFMCAGISDFRFALAYMLAYGISMAAILLWMPVRCDAPGCDGHMRRSFVRESFFKTNVHYTCKSCGMMTDHLIYFPDISVEVSG